MTLSSIFRSVSGRASAGGSANNKEPRLQPLAPISAQPWLRRGHPEHVLCRVPNRRPRRLPGEAQLNPKGP